jgi:hypothetical protein
MTITIRPLVVALLAAGCAEAPDTRTCGGGQALRTEQGSQLNGTAANGRYLNGMQINGVQMNGVQINGRTPNATSLSTSLQGRYLNGVNLQGTELRGTIDGAPVGMEALVGATLEALTADGGTITLRITAVERDPADPELVYASLATADGENICGPQGRGLFVGGVWDDSGARRESADLITYSCTHGVIAKCVAWGYKPWRVGPDLHQACTRMARADYCGDGMSHTENGTTIDVFDGRGIQSPSTTPEQGFVFEAGWGPDGAVCVSHPRYRDVGADGRTRPPSCWSALPRCHSFAEAHERGAVIANASVERTRLVCGP